MSDAKDDWGARGAFVATLVRMIGTAEHSMLIERYAAIADFRHALLRLQ